jgi:hypothetical protein
MINPASLNNQAARSSAEDSIPKRLAAIEARLRELTVQRSLESATIGGGGLRSEDFDGVLDPPAAGTQGWGLSGENGNAIFNNIVLRGGIIGDDALANPITAMRLQASNTIFSISTTFASKASDTVTTPAGFTSALIMAIGQISAINSRGSAGLLKARVSVDGFPNAPQVGEAGPSAYTQVSNSYATVLGTLAFASPLTSGQVIPISVEAAVDTGSWSPVTGSDNLAALSVIALFLR